MFHKITANFLAVLYIVAMLKPVAPIVEYAVNYDYISTILCINKEKTEMDCNGKCYVMQQLENQQEEDFNSLQISMEEYPIGFVEIIQLNKRVSFFIQKKEKLFSDYQNYSFLAVSSFFHPPEA